MKIYFDLYKFALFLGNIEDENLGPAYLQIGPIEMINEHVCPSFLLYVHLHLFFYSFKLICYGLSVNGWILDQCVVFIVSYQKD